MHSAQNLLFEFTLQVDCNARLVKKITDPDTKTRKIRNHFKPETWKKIITIFKTRNCKIKKIETIFRLKNRKLEKNRNRLQICNHKTKKKSKPFSNPKPQTEKNRNCFQT